MGQVPLEVKKRIWPVSKKGRKDRKWKIGSPVGKGRRGFLGMGLKAEGESPIE